MLHERLAVGLILLAQEDPALRRGWGTARPALPVAQVPVWQAHASKGRRADEPLDVDSLTQPVDDLQQRPSVVAELAAAAELEVPLRVRVFADEPLPRAIHLVAHQPHDKRRVTREAYLPCEARLHARDLFRRVERRVLRGANLESTDDDEASA